MPANSLLAAMLVTLGVQGVADECQLYVRGQLVARLPVEGTQVTATVPSGPVWATCSSGDKVSRVSTLGMPPDRDYTQGEWIATNSSIGAYNRIKWQEGQP